jgi:threonine synthase
LKETRKLGNTLLGEGNTPCVASARIPNLYFKLENCNPSGSYKDRFIARELLHLRERNVRRVIATSSGNTGASLAAYAARAGIECIVFANADTPSGKLLQMRAHGATVVRVPRFAADADVTSDVFATLQASGLPLVVSAFRYCPVGMTGVETISQELIPLQPQHVFAPVGGGGLYAAIVQGFAGATKVHAVQPAGCATVVAPWLRGQTQAAILTSTTRISGLSVPMDIDATLALQRLYECGGQGIAVTDEEVFAAQRRLLQTEGIFCEPAGATAFAGFLKYPTPGKTVCIVTGHGFKDPASIEAVALAHGDSPTVDAGQIRKFFLDI